MRALPLVALLALVSGCDDTGQPPTGNPPVIVNGLIQTVSVSPSSLTVNVGETFTLQAGVTATPGPITSYNVSWSSADPSIANVGPGGVVVGNAPGSTTITAASVVIPNITGSASVRVVTRGSSSVAAR